MIDNQDENYIAEMFGRLPRKPEVSGRKEVVWLRIQNELRSTRLAAPEPRSAFFLQYRFNRYSLGALIVLVAVSLAGGAAYAAQSSLPGETLYPVKIATEKVQIALATSDEQKVQVLSSHAKNRLQEVSKLVEAKKQPEVVTQTLAALKDTTNQVVAVSAQKPELVGQAAALAATETQVLSSVEPQTQGEVKQAVQEALATSRESLNKLQNPEETPTPTVKGTESLNASSTPAAVQKTGAAAQRTSKTARPIRSITPGEGYIESPIQIGGVINGDNGETIPPVQP